MRSSWFQALFLGAAVLGCQTAQAAGLVEYKGDGDPTAAGWKKVASGQGSIAKPAHRATEPAWEIRDEPGGGWLKYVHSLPEELLKNEEGWTATARLRFKDGGGSRQLGQFLRVHDGEGYWLLDVRGGPESGLYGYGGWLNHFRPGDGRFHTFQMRKGPGTDRVVYFVDGHKVGHAIRRKVRAGERGVEFGTNSGGQTSAGQWALVRVEPGDAVVPPVPGTDPPGQSLRAGGPRDWTVTYELGPKRDVAIDPGRLFHGPAAIEAPNGDWLVCYQDSRDHIGTDGVISQVRSSDRGRTWKPEGIVFDGRGEQIFARNPAYGLTADGKLVLVVQGWNRSILGSVWLVSRDNGRSWEERGFVDAETPTRHNGCSSAIIRDGDRLLMAAINVAEEDEDVGQGIGIYALTDLDRGWRFLGLAIRAEDLPVDWTSYGSLHFRPDGTLVCQSNYRRSFQAFSDDGGRTWSEPRELKDITLRNDLDVHYAGDVLVAHGRGADASSSEVWFSADRGLTWGHPIVVDRYGFLGGGGYTAAIPTKDGVFIVFSTDAGPHTGRQPGVDKPDLRGVLLEDVTPRFAEDYDLDRGNPFGAALDNTGKPH